MAKGYRVRDDLEIYDASKVIAYLRNEVYELKMKSNDIVFSTYRPSFHHTIYREYSEIRNNNIELQERIKELELRNRELESDYKFASNLYWFVCIGLLIALCVVI